MFETLAVRVVSGASLLDPVQTQVHWAQTLPAMHLCMWGGGTWGDGRVRGEEASVGGDGHPPQLPGNHDGHAVTHSFSLCHVVGRQEGAPLCVFNGGPDRLPTSSKDHLQLRKPSN